MTNLYSILYNNIVFKSQILMCFKLSVSSSMEMEKMVGGNEEVPMQELIPPSYICQMDVIEWVMEMRENNILMDELNIEVKEGKMKDNKQIECRQRKAKEKEIVEKEKDVDDREKYFDMREKELVSRKQSLEEMELEIIEKKKDVALRHEKLDRKETRLGRKRRIFEMLIQMNEFR